MLPGCVHQMLQTIRGKLSVVIEQEDKRMGTGGDSTIDGNAEPSVFGKGNDPDIRE